MNLKNIYKITPLRLATFSILYIIIWLLHEWCLPYLWTGGAPLGGGKFGGGIETKCGFFSKWILDNDIVYSVYTNINSWHILIIVIFVVLFGNLVVEIVKSEKQNKNNVRS
ncbi:MAG: hypothetical protein V1712_03665 [Patescibacteria group bacterium]